VSAHRGPTAGATAAGAAAAASAATAARVQAVRRSGAPAQRVGRFELLGELGRGAQASVWLAHDPRLDREVAIKLLDASSDVVSVSQWLDEARAVSRLTHPNIVPVFEADQIDGQPYLVFELVQGRTLAELRGQRSAREAIDLTLAVLDALAAAHAHGIVHRDLKPSNILLGADGRVRVMDFGIAARVSVPGDGRIVGTPRYMSPEAARGEAPVPAMDVFAAGLLLAELLTGTPLVTDRDPLQALQRVRDEDLALPPGGGIDDGLRAIVRRALQRDRAARFDSALGMHAALSEWLHGPDQDEASDAGSGAAALEFLLRRMRTKSDFPALSSAVGRIQRLTSSETESLNSLAAEILKDVALTHKLLRLVNTVHFSQAGAGSIGTVSRAVALIGFAGVRNLALSLTLLEHMDDRTRAGRMKEEFLRALVAGTLAADLAHEGRDGEEAYLGSLFQNLGRLLVEYYFPEEAQRIALLADGAAASVNRDTTARQVLGIGLDDLACGVAKAWGLPESLQRCMKAPTGEPPARAAEAGPERLRWLGRATNAAADLVLDPQVERFDARAQAWAKRHAAVLGVSAERLAAAAQRVQLGLAPLARAMGIEPSAGSALARRLATPVRAAGDAADADPLRVDIAPAAPMADAATEVLGDAGEAQRTDLLVAGVQDITETLASESFKLNDVLRMVMETMFRALAFRRVIFCLRDPRTDTLTGRFGLGLDADTVAKAFKVPLDSGKGDLFAAICQKSADTLLADTTLGDMAARLPGWYRTAAGAPTLLLLPMSMNKKPFGLLYADKAMPNSIVLTEKELSLLRTLRNQAVMAFRQAQK